MAENLIASSIRMSETQWKTCDEMAQKMKLRSRNEFIRNAVDFYTEWCQCPQSAKFLTPALESVIGAKVRDSENRIARMLYKLAVEQNCLLQMLGATYDFENLDLDRCHLLAERQVKRENGSLPLKTDPDTDSDYDDDDYEE